MSRKAPLMALMVVIVLLITGFLSCAMGEEQTTTLLFGESKKVVKTVNEGDGIVVWWTVRNSLTDYIGVSIEDNFGNVYHKNEVVQDVGGFLFIAPKTAEFSVIFKNKWQTSGSSTFVYSVDVVQIYTWNTMQDNINAQQNSTLLLLRTTDSELNNTVLYLASINDIQNTTLASLNLKNNEQDADINELDKINDRQDTIISYLGEINDIQNTTLSLHESQINTIKQTNNLQDERISNMEKKNVDQDNKITSINAPIAGVGLIAVLGFLMAIILLIQNRKLSKQIKNLEMMASPTTTPPNLPLPPPIQQSPPTAQPYMHIPPQIPSQPPAQTPVKPSQTYCGHCGKSSTPELGFCPHCGNPKK
jgi:hypothetical protein